MKTPALLLSLVVVAAHATAADPIPVPDKSLAAKKELLFSDDFEGAEPAKPWHKVVQTFTFEKGTLKGTQTRDKDVPSADGKSVVKAHAAVHGLEVPTKDSVVEVKIKFDGATMIDIEFDDRKYAGAHYGHICRAQVRLTGVTLIDERDGGMKNDIYEMKKDPAKKAEVAKLLVGRSATYPMKLETGKLYVAGYGGGTWEERTAKAAGLYALAHAQGFTAFGWLMHGEAPGQPYLGLLEGYSAAGGVPLPGEPQPGA